MNTTDQRLVSRRQIMSLLGVSRSSTYRMQESGILKPPIQLGQRLLRWRLQDVMALMGPSQAEK